MARIFHLSLRIRISGFSTLELLITFSLFGVILSSVFSIFRNELADMGFAKGEAGASISFLTIENRIRGLLLPSEEVPSEASAWQTGRGAGEAISLSLDNRSLHRGHSTLTTASGRLVWKSEGRERVLYTSSPGIYLKALDFRLDNRLLSARITLLVGETERQGQFSFLLPQAM